MLWPAAPSLKFSKQAIVVYVLNAARKNHRTVIFEDLQA